MNRETTEKIHILSRSKIRFTVSRLSSIIENIKTHKVPEEYRDDVILAIEQGRNGSIDMHITYTRPATEQEIYSEDMAQIDRAESHVFTCRMNLRKAESELKDIESQQAERKK